ncbi:hypothetical protein HMPREF9999_00975 [Alloprevotella sp. oral taxon 473 str. F0040]|nr:hypothetical protein HMPREF9999_00975 [Alloprevotella sp. oral taxon 473 str. F0040]
MTFLGYGIAPMLLVSVGAFLFAPCFAVHPYIDMGGYSHKV